MHRVFHIAELVDMILANLPKSSLVSVARTTRLLHVPAAAEIWRQADNEAIRSLADTVLKPFEADGGELQLSASARWERVCLYSSRIQELNLEFNPVFEADSMWRRDIHTMACFRPCVPLLPRLRVLNATCENPEDLDCIAHFLSPSLTRLDLDCGMENDSKDEFEIVAAWGMRLCTLLFKLTHESPELRELSICGWKDLGLVFGDALQSAITSLPLLQVFESHITALSGRVLSALADSTSLARLRVGHGDDDRTISFDAPTIASSINPAGFASLRVLSVEANLSTATSLLMAMPGGLTEMSFTIVSAEFFSADELRSFVTSLVRVSSRLLKLEWRLTDYSWGPMPFLWEHVAGVLQCLAIVHFCFAYKSNNSFDFHDGHLTSLAEAWPGLKSLTIGWTPLKMEDEQEASGLHDEKGLTLASLVKLALNCPKLEFLCLAFVEATGGLPTPPLIPTPARLLDIVFGKANISSPEDVALFLCTIWPKVAVSLYSKEDDEQTRSWQLVSLMIQVAQSHHTLQSMPALRGSSRFLSIQGALRDVVAGRGV